MDTLNNPSLRKRVDQFITDAGDDALTWVEIHGLMCAVATGPEAPADWPAACHAEDQVPADIAAALVNLKDRIAATLGAGEPIKLPCRLDPYAEDEGADLASWCAGFMAGVYLQEAAWYAADEDTAANLLLPMVLIAGLDDDPALDDLWQDSKLVRQMAMGIPELLEELFLFYHAPDLASGEDADGDDQDD
ncbi:YecA/YgfB family protein [Isoalcanivorax beigongshangi]|uniref:YecA family protein n=1 Tax=Isoalcanivorax beigongshangi TaxID=3238810 RepID=A0ABV4AH72_9GAMM